MHPNGTTTHVSTVLALLLSRSTASVHGRDSQPECPPSTKQFYVGLVSTMETTTCLDVTYTALAGGQLNSATLEVIKANSSFLLIKSRRNSIQLLWQFGLPGHFRPHIRASLFPCRLLQAVWDVSLYHIASNYLAFCSCFSEQGIDILSAYARKILTFVGRHVR